MMRARAVFCALVPYGLAALGGWLWSLAGMPLAWVLGAASVTGVMAMTGRSVSVPKALNKAGLVVIGAGVGLSVTPDVAGAMVQWAPVMVGSTALSIALAIPCARLMARWGKVDLATAFFSLLPGGVFEMAAVAERHGGDRMTISILHALRVGLIVTLIPLALALLDAQGSFELVAYSRPVSPWGIAVLLGVGALGGWAAQRAGLAAGWLVGPMVSVSLLSMTGLPVGGLPPAGQAAAQVLVGMALGARFKREALLSVPRAALVGMAVLLVIGVIMALAAALMASVSEEPFGTLVLCFATGGMAEMVLTAKALSQNAALVAAFHAIRAIAVNSLAGSVWRRLGPRDQAREKG